MSYKVYRTDECPKEIAREYSPFQLDYFKYVVVWGFRSQLFKDEPSRKDITSWMQEVQQLEAERAEAKAQKLAAEKAQEDRRRIGTREDYRKGDDSIFGSFD